MLTNTKVHTPLGSGMVQGRFAIPQGDDRRDGNGDAVANALLVRLPVNDMTRPALNRSNCVTPMAEMSGLWVFAESEVQNV